MDAKRVEVRITGLVQGVFFRQWVKEKAEELEFTGWVRNEPDGSVKIVAEGEEGKLQKLVLWCRKGTEWSRVDRIEVGWQEAEGKFEKFVTL